MHEHDRQRRVGRADLLVVEREAVGGGDRARAVGGQRREPLRLGLGPRPQSADRAALLDRGRRGPRRADGGDAADHAPDDAPAAHAPAPTCWRGTRGPIRVTIS